MVPDDRTVSFRAPVDGGNCARPRGIRRRGLAGADNDPPSLVGRWVSACLRTRNHCWDDADYRGHRFPDCLYDAALREIESGTGNGLRNAKCGLWIILVLPDRIRRRALHGKPAFEIEHSNPAHKNLGVCESRPSTGFSLCGFSFGCNLFSGTEKRGVLIFCAFFVLVFAQAEKLTG